MAAYRKAKCVLMYYGCITRQVPRSLRPLAVMSRGDIYATDGPAALAKRIRPGHYVR